MWRYNNGPKSLRFKILRYICHHELILVVKYKHSFISGRFPTRGMVKLYHILHVREKNCILEWTLTSGVLLIFSIPLFFTSKIIMYQTMGLIDNFFFQSKFYYLADGSKKYFQRRRGMIEKRRLVFRSRTFLRDILFWIINFNCILNMIRITFLSKEMVEKKANLSLSVILK